KRPPRVPGPDRRVREIGLLDAPEARTSEGSPRGEWPGGREASLIGVRASARRSPDPRRCPGRRGGGGPRREFPPRACRLSASLAGKSTGEFLLAPPNQLSGVWKCSARLNVRKTLVLRRRTGSSEIRHRCRHSAPCRA